MTDDDKALVEAMKDAVLHGTGFMKNGKHVPIDDVYLDPRDAHIEALITENERLREALQDVSAIWRRHKYSGDFDLWLNAHISAALGDTK